jgi:hypothetical protein
LLAPKRIFEEPNGGCAQVRDRSVFYRPKIDENAVKSRMNRFFMSF